MRKKRLFKITFMILIICCILCGCGQIDKLLGDLGVKSSPEDTVKQLEKAINKADIEKMLDCCSSSVSKVLSGGSSLLGDVLGFDIGAAAQLGSGLLGMYSDPLEGHSVSLKATDVEYEDEENCLVTVSIIISDDFGYSETGMQVLPMILEDGKWKLKITLDDLGLE